MEEEDGAGNDKEDVSEDDAAVAVSEASADLAAFPRKVLSAAAKVERKLAKIFRLGRFIGF